ncbi:hypothetical protein [Chromobacterium vaccinii]|uniref:capsular polysaccharide export protein, LipB/KpsS family n=1 Tax=Chromobacterium vaccinii TaxID=1108595 RepID=UPI001319E29F|nr:hypothetical protein [Chromobacterium vaccinii]
MNILYWLDPFTMPPGSRAPTLRWHIEPLFRAMSGNSSVSMMVLTDSQSLSQAEPDVLQVPVQAIPRVEKIRAMPEGAARQAAIRQTVLKAARDFQPDLIIAYETHAPWLHELFPSAVVINESWGALTRMPFPALCSYDSSGIYQESILARNADAIRTHRINDDERHALQAVRANMVAALAATDPVYRMVGELQTRFSKLVLLPLQLDGHDSFTGCATWDSHRHMVEEVLATLPRDFGLVVTQHPDHQPVLDQAAIAALQDSHPNFVYIQELEQVPMLSQWWLLHVNAIATVSSGLAFQAAIMGVPVIALGHSHINLVASGALAEAETLIRSEVDPSLEIDSAMWWMLTRYSVFLDESMSSSANMVAHFAALLLMGQRGSDQNPLEWPRRYDNEQLLELFSKWSRVDRLQKLLADRQVDSQPNELLVKITQAKAVSFDLFDTLVQRPFMEPHDLFQMIEGRVRRITGNASLHYARWRRRAEEEARKKRNWKEVTITHIYREFANLTGYSHEICEQIAAIEFEAETEVLTRREPIYQQFVWARRMGKVVSIITDIYLEQPAIERLLERVGIQGFSHLFVSAELDLRKHDGTIFPHYQAELKEQHGIEQSPDWHAMLHVGDNPRADVEKAREHNLRVHWIPRHAECLRKSALAAPFAHNLARRWTSDSVVMGLIANRFGSHLQHAHRDNLFGGSLYAFGYMAGAPMLTAFVQWLAHRIRARGFKRVCFMARDGYMLRLIYDRLRQAPDYADLPPSDYLYFSRRSAALASCYNTDDLIELLHLSFANRKLGDLLLHRFGLEADAVPPTVLKRHALRLKDEVSHQHDLAMLGSLIHDLREPILERARREREGALSYLGSKNIPAEADSVCMVDIGYSGSIQRYINKMLDSKIAGYYMLTHEAARQWFDGVTFEGWLASFDEQRSADYHKLNDHVFLFETLLSSEENSVRAHLIDENGDNIIEWVEEEQNDVRLHFMRQVHAGVQAFIDDFVGSLGRFCSEVQIGREFGEKLFLHLAEHPSAKDARLFTGLGVENGFGGGDAVLLYHVDQDKAAALTQTERNYVLGKSQWKSAALALYGARPHPASPVSGFKQPAATSTNAAAPQPLASAKPRYEDIPTALRKYLKFKRDPYSFFNDSRNIFVRPLRFFYRDFNRKPVIGSLQTSKR